jgi:hypothetical protein
LKASRSSFAAIHPLEKKRAGRKPCSKNCVDPISPEKLDLLLFDGATLLGRVRVPPETWTTSPTSRLA